MLPNIRMLRAVIAAGLALATLAAAPAMADLTGIDLGQIELSDTERDLVNANPALLDLAAISPALLRQALDLIAAALASEPTGRGGLEGLDREDVQLLGQNPALLQVWRSSPEASADLLELMRTAGGAGKSQK